MLTIEQLKQLKTLLSTQKKDARNITHTEDIKSEHLADDTDIAALDTAQTISTKLVSRKQLYLKKIDEALARMDNKTYGECEACYETIAFKRLLARPAATLCIECKEDEELQENRKKNPNSIPISDWEPEN